MPGKREIAAAAALALTLGGPTLAGDFQVTDWIQLVDSVELGGGDSVGGSTVLPDDVSGVIGFEIRFEFINPTGDGSWASDLHVILETPDGRTYSVGGQTHLPQSDVPWSFQGFISAPDGVYGDSGNDIFMPGAWQDDPPGGGAYALTFVNDWNGDFFPNIYNDLNVRFYILSGTGACCLADGSCLEGVSEDACLENPEHVSWNRGLTCAEAECEAIIGACCLADGSCLEWISEVECLENPEHVSWNGGLTCAEAACEPIIGACCLADGTCLEWITEDECLGKPEHVSWNGGLTCAEAECEAIIGACCLADGSCLEWISEDECLGNPEHVSWNGGLTCAEAECEAIIGACCLADGSCLEWITEDECLGKPEHVSWNGGLTCAEAACEPIIGACCLADGTCLEWSTEDECLGKPEHVSWNGGLTCAEAECEAIIGACCLADGSCLEWISEVECLENPEHVSWNGGLTCVEAACEPIIGACCLADGSCLEWITEDECLGNPDHVSWNGGLTCAEAVCEPIIGACCLEDGSCLEWISEDECLGNPEHVSWNGGLTCAEAACEATVGACCLDDGSCLESVSESACMSQAGFASWNRGLTCAEAACAPTIGACCLTDGSCLEAISEVECLGNPEHVSWNGGLTCAEAACEPTIGACCLADGSCLEAISEDECLDHPEHVSWNGGLTCVQAACEATIGACCLDDGSCLESISETACMSQAGYVSWNRGLTCAEADCQPVLGACCFPVLEPTDCCVDGKPRILTLQYTGDDCSATSHSQDPGKVACDDLAPLTDLVYIVANDGDDPESGRIWFQGDVALGDTFDLDAANGGEDHLKSSSHLHVFDHEGGTLLQQVEFHTSCSQPLFVGDQFGSALVVGCIGEDAPLTPPGGAGDCEDLMEADCVAAGGVYQGDGTVCAETLCFIGACCLPPSSADCCANGKPRVLTMRYTGDDCSATQHDQDPSKVECDDHAPLTPVVYIVANDDENPASTPVWFAGAVALDGTFDLDAQAGGESHLKSTTWLHVYDEEGGTLLQRVKFHTSCSQPLFVGNQFGAAAVVGCIGEDRAAFAGEPALCEDLTEGECVARGGVFQGEGVFCADDPCPFGACCLPPGGLDCCEDGKPRILTMRYTGDDCSATQHTQDPSKVECTDVAPLTPIVYIVANDDENPASTTVWFEGEVALDATFDLDAQAGGESHLKSTSWLHVFEEQGGALLQRVKFHTSCSQPLFVGNQFGSALVVGCVGEDAALPANGGGGSANGGGLVCIETSEVECLALGGVYQGDDTTCDEIDCGGEGCTPGYWKQPHHFDDWTAPYEPTTPFAEVFDDAFPDQTLLDVLEQGGGTLIALGRHTVAALLNAAAPDVAYGLTPTQVIDLFNDTYPSGRNEYEELKDYFESLNEQGCPLGGGLTSRDRLGSGDGSTDARTADANGDGRVDFQDVLRVLAAWGACARCPEDLDGDGHVDFVDLLRVLENLE